MNEKLKPCPFCGGDAELANNAMDAPEFPDWVECKSCGAETLSQDTRDEAILAWNTRAKTAVKGNFVVTVMAQGEKTMGFRTIILNASSEDEAVGMAMRKFNEQEPDLQFSIPAALHVFAALE